MTFEFTDARPIYSGYVRDAISYALLEWVFLAFAIGGAHRGFVRWARFRRYEPGVCPRCRYAMGPLEQCPECGWTARLYADRGPSA